MTSADAIARAGKLLDAAEEKIATSAQDVPHLVAIAEKWLTIAHMMSSQAQ